MELLTNIRNILWAQSFPLRVSHSDNLAEKDGEHSILNGDDEEEKGIGLFDGYKKIGAP